MRWQNVWTVHVWTGPALEHRPYSELNATISRQRKKLVGEGEPYSTQTSNSSFANFGARSVSVTVVVRITNKTLTFHYGQNLFAKMIDDRRIRRCQRSFLCHANLTINHVLFMRNAHPSMLYANRTYCDICMYICYYYLSSTHSRGEICCVYSVLLAEWFNLTAFIRM